MTRYEATKIREVIEKATVSLDDKTASEAPTLFPSLKYDGTLIASGTRINWNGMIKRAAVDLWNTEENNPDNAPTVWEDIAYKGGYRIIPETITAGTAFSADELGWWGEDLYKSLIDSNVWTPEQHAAGWEKVDT